MNSIIIESNRTRYLKKSYLNNKKDILIENFKHEIISENLNKAYYFLFDMINSGFFTEIWAAYFIIYTEYIHFLNPDLLRNILTNFDRFKKMKKNARQNKLELLQARNEFNFRKVLFLLLKKIVKSPKKHIGYFIPQSFNNQHQLTAHTPLFNIFQNEIPNLDELKGVINNQDFKDIELALKQFQHHIDISIHKKYTFDQQKFMEKENCFFWLAKILVVGAENTNIIGYPYNISLYHSVDTSASEYFIPIIWHILLNGSKLFGKEYLKHMIHLYKIYDSKMLHKTKKENFLIIQAVLLLFEHVVWNVKIYNLDDFDYTLIDAFYEKYQTKVPEKSEVKLKSKKVLDKSQSDLEKLIKERELDIHIPPVNPKMDIKAVKKNNDVVIIDEDDKKKPKLPSILFEFIPQSKNDIKVCNAVNDAKRIQHIPLTKNMQVNRKYSKKTKLINVIKKT